MIYKCSCNEPYKKLNENEDIQVGDLISLEPIPNKVKLAKNGLKKKDDQVIRYLYKN